MRRIQRHSLDWAGDMFQSPHGDWVHINDVQRLEDDIADAKALIVSLRGDLDAARPAVTSEPVACSGATRLFGWVAPEDARLFNSGRKSSCRVYKKRTGLFCMPLSNHLGPNHYQKPPVGAVVTIFGGDSATVAGHVPEGLTVAAGGIEFNITKWSWNNAKQND